MYSNITDVVTGITLSGRTAQLPGIEHIVGPTIATMPFRTSYSDEQLISDLLQMVQQNYIDIILFQQLGLRNIKSLGSEAAVAGDFRSLLVIHSTNERESPTVLFSDQNFNLFLDYPLAIECELREEGVGMKTTFDDLVLNPVEVRRIWGQFEYLLHQLCKEDPATTVTVIQTACLADTKQLLEWDSKAPDAYQACVHDLIKQRAKVQPGYPAICSWDRNFSFSALKDLSSLLASYLAT